jgi:hypothetical protein
MPTKLQTGRLHSIFQNPALFTGLARSRAQNQRMDEIGSDDRRLRMRLYRIAQKPTNSVRSKLFSPVAVHWSVRQ